mgnify:CR=1 FL=1
MTARYKNGDRISTIEKITLRAVIEIRFEE